MGENMDIILDQEIEKNKTLSYQLLSDHQICSILGQTQRLHGKESPSEVFSVLSEIINRVYSRLRKTANFDPNRMWNQSTRELLTKSEVFFMNPCLEYSLLTLQYMKQAGFKDVHLIINELSTIDPKLYKLHFGVEGTHNGEEYFIDHKRQNFVNIGKGQYSCDYSDVHEFVVNTMLIPADIIGIDDSFPDLYKQGIVTFKYFSPELLVFFKEKFQKSNTPGERENGFVAKVKDPNKPEILIKE